MVKRIDTKTILLVLLTAAAVVLTFLRERPVSLRESPGHSEMREVLPLAEITAVVDSTLRRMGVVPEKIRRVKISAGEVKGVREELRVQVPAGFEVLRAITTLTDSLRRFNVVLVSTENLKEKTSSIHLLHDKKVFQSIVIAKEQRQKGLPSSASKKQKAAPRKTRR